MDDGGAYLNGFARANVSSGIAEACARKYILRNRVESMLFFSVTVRMGFEMEWKKKKHVYIRVSGSCAVSHDKLCSTSPSHPHFSFRRQGQARRVWRRTGYERNAVLQASAHTQRYTFPAHTSSNANEYTWRQMALLRFEERKSGAGYPWTRHVL